MSTAAQSHISPAPQGWFSRAESWLDQRGKGAWIAAMVVSFILFWPVGLALLAYMIWSKRMFSKSCSHHRHHMSGDQHFARRHGFRSSGNTAFDAYKAETLRRLMDEQEAFENFLERLRAAKDKSEFDQFMDERADATRDAAVKAGDDLADEADTLDEPGKNEK
ncbi:hypothetical protein XMM379_002020 [Aliiroseovarius sp. xm-m-379]|uniref:DUF2852 domain-containing protein n=1 Tax=Aliiroseovarius crassostreae TaxID=154981 RepID=A0A9Q9LY62_9RHOB|nr:MULTISPECIES: DUF2852 domain-containing protein [Aliiroseovarius]NRP12097.1 hypothetical protein [Aliiroseovarius sp. xm-d-517]NRP25325.1 hypothetical protein [Aliiroseovarius sp. xm-m-379]NRP30947.1 hypothetical protein [Aliiroseovarius sp. xm-m-314]NRP34124.1 hypothetical protein [Aliiroseovarius sp. xm-a-104]NRP41409.1 hypothetical protein [Aliiroseovarius sp. xm-m-339-2]